MNKKIVLITSLYQEQQATRITELLYCLNNNLSNTEIAKVCVVFDGWNDQYPDSTIKKSIESNKAIDLEHCTGKPSFSRLFSIANTRYPSDIVIIANADIHYDHSLQLLHTVSLDNKFILLSRYNLDSNNNWKLITLKSGLPNYFSFDSFIFTAPISLAASCDFSLGTMLSDSFLAKSLFDYTELQVYNPCYELKSYHVQTQLSISEKHSLSDDKALVTHPWRLQYLKNNLSTPNCGCKWSYLHEMDLPYSHQVIWKSNLNIYMNLEKISDLAVLDSVARQAEYVQKALWVYSSIIPYDELVTLLKDCNSIINILEGSPSEPDLVSYISSKEASLAAFLDKHRPNSIHIYSTELHALRVGTIELLENQIPKIGLIQLTDQNQGPSGFSSTDSSIAKVQLFHVEKGDLTIKLLEKISATYQLTHLQLMPPNARPIMTAYEQLLAKVETLPKIILFKTRHNTEQPYYTNPSVGFTENLKHWGNNGLGLSYANLLFHVSLLPSVHLAKDTLTSNLYCLDFILEHFSSTETLKVNTVVAALRPETTAVPANELAKTWTTDYYSVIHNWSAQLSSEVQNKYIQLRDEAYSLFQLFRV